MKHPSPKVLPVTRAMLAPGLRRYLYLTASVTGAAILIVEILGAKMLAPYVGTSHFVWTAQIAVTLVALATGYYVGGRMVDRSQGLGRLYGCILCAALYLGLTVLIVEPVAYWCIDFKLAVGSLLASAFLFFVPLALLAMAGPFFVRVLTVAVEGVGGSVGRLTAISTLGSFAGTVLIGYVFIPYFPNSITMYVTSGLLMAVSAGYFFGWGRKQTSPAIIATVLILGLLLGGLGVAGDRPAKGLGWHEIARANSNFGRLQVIETDGNVRYFLNDFLDQDSYDPIAKQSTDAFTYMLHGLAHGYTAHIGNVLCIGLGVGIVPMKFAQEGAQVDVVEINPAVVPLATRFFDFEPARVDLTIDDGRHFINRCAKKYDAIILDAFLGESSPSHLMSREAFAAMQRLLNPGGVLVINTLGNLQAGKDFFMASLDATLKTVFRQVRVHAAGDQEIINVFFVASDQPEMTLHNQLPISEVNQACRQEVQDAYNSPVFLNIDPRHGRVLTDDYNPVEYYDAANRELLRKELVAVMRH
ncbi:MAG TPA: fused MFS/spermidine synthase [Opitutaceae bacterium]|nr:fused MFS/spermidine synthase [Opitutaceae bacterium]